MKVFDLVMITADEWNGIQRLRHRVAHHFCIDHRVLFVENPRLSILSVFRDLKRLRNLMPFGRIVKHGNMCIYTPPLVFPFAEKFPLIDLINNYVFKLCLKRVSNKLGFKNVVIWYFYYNHASIVGSFNEILSIYTAHDVWEETEKRPKAMTLSMEKSMLDKVDLAFFTSYNNFENKKKHNSNSVYMPHGAPAHSSLGRTRPADMPRTGRILGYWGVIDSSSIDIDLIRDIATAFPDDSIVLIGMVPKPFTNSLNTLITLKNVRYLGMKKRDEMVSYVGCFDVGLIPYPRIPFRVKCSPLKVYDYMSLGIPPVSIDIDELKTVRDYVYIALDNAAFIDCVTSALKEGDEMKKERLNFCRNNTWDHRLNQMASIINDRISDMDRVCGRHQ